MSVTIKPDGWTEILPEGDSREVWVSASGNDSKAGTSKAEAVRTIARGMSLGRHGHGDQIVLVGTDTFNEPIGRISKSGESAEEPFVIRSDGTGRAKIRGPASAGGMFTNGGGGTPPRVDHVALIGLDLEPVGRTGGEDCVGVQWLHPALDVLFENCRFAGFHTNAVFQKWSDPLVNFRLRRCQFLDSWGNANSGHSNGMYTDGTIGLVAEECLFDHNGYDSPTADTGANVFRHNAYCQAGQAPTTLRGCVVSRGSSHGAQLRSGGVVDSCLFTKNSIALLVGTSYATQPQGIPALVKGTVFLDGKDISPAEKRGWAMVLANISSGRVTSNVIAHCKGGYPQGVWLDGDAGVFGVENLSLSKNIMHDWPGGLNQTGAPGRIRNVTENGNDWNRAASACVDPTRNVPANYLQTLRTMHKGNWDKKLWPLGGINRGIMAGYALK